MIIIIIICITTTTSNNDIVSLSLALSAPKGVICLQKFGLQKNKNYVKDNHICRYTWDHLTIKQCLAHELQSLF